MQIINQYRLGSTITVHVTSDRMRCYQKEWELCCKSFDLAIWNLKCTTSFCGNWKKVETWVSNKWRYLIKRLAAKIEDVVEQKQSGHAMSVAFNCGGGGGGRRGFHRLIKLCT